MRKFLLLLCVPIILFSGDLKKALQKSHKERKPLMVLVTATKCKYCAKMKKETLNNPDVKENLNGFLFVQVDKNSFDVKKHLPKVRYTPTIFFISQNYHIVNTVKGYLNAYDFNMWIDDTRKKLNMPILTHIKKSDESSYVQPEENSVWLYDIASAIDFANQTGKNIMVFVGSTRSKWSKKMEETTLKSKNVMNRLDDFVWVKINYGDREAKKYGINPKGVPAVYFLRADMSQLAVAKGYYKDKDFIKWIKYAKSKL